MYVLSEGGRFGLAKSVLALIRVGGGSAASVRTPKFFFSQVRYKIDVKQGKKNSRKYSFPSPPFS